jgi:hypothetical protein
MELGSRRRLYSWGAGAATVCLAGVLLVGSPARGQAPTRPCTVEELAQARLVDGHLEFKVVHPTEGVVEGRLRSHTAYGIEVRGGSPVVDDSIRVSDPGGSLLVVPGAPLPTFTLTTAGAGVLALTFAWDQEVQDARGNVTGRCTGSGVATLQVADPSLVRLRAQKGVDFLALIIKLGLAPQSNAPLVYELRVRKGRAAPPSLATKPLARLRFKAGQLGPGPSIDNTLFPIVVFRTESISEGAAVVAHPYPFDVGKHLRYGISIRAVQGGKVVGGVRSGVDCRYTLRAAPGGGKAYQVTCRYPGFAFKP